MHGDIILPNVTNTEQFKKEMQAWLLKTTRRNGSQTKGPNAGRRQGL